MTLALRERSTTWQANHYEPTSLDVLLANHHGEDPEVEDGGVPREETV